MDFELSEEQRALAEATRGFLEQRWSSDRMRRALDNPPAEIPDELWSEIAELGWIGIASAEDVGGSGGDILTACVLAEEAGRGLLPVAPFSVLVAAVAIERSGDNELGTTVLPEVCRGEKRVVIAIEEAGGSWGPDAVRTEAVAKGDEWLLRGTKILVPDTEKADCLLVAARTPEGLGLVLVPTDAAGLTITPMRRLDGQSIAEVHLDEVQTPSDALLVAPAGSEPLLREAYDIWTTLASADLLGVAEASLEMTATYAKDRVQFGRPIGSFQAVAHRLADRLVEIEVARSLLYAACLSLDESQPQSPALVSAVKAWVSDVAVSATEASIHLHGGVGFTWELDAHLYLRRARAGAATLGDADYHRDRVARHMGERSQEGEEE